MGLCFFTERRRVRRNWDIDEFGVGYHELNLGKRSYLASTRKAVSTKGCKFGKELTIHQLV